MAKFVGLSNSGGTDEVYKSTDLVAFSGTASPVEAQIDSHVAAYGNGKLYFAATDGDVYTYDTATQVIAALNLGFSGTDSYSMSLAFDPNRDRLYVAANKSVDGPLVGYWDGATFTEIAGASVLEPANDGTYVAALCVTPDGTVFTQRGNDVTTSRQKILRWSPDSETWTDDIELTVGSVFGRISFNLYRFYAAQSGEVFLGTKINSGAAAKYVFQRTAAGVWSDITQATMTDAGGAETWGLIVHNDNLYVGWFNDAFTRAELWKRTSAGVWTLDFDLLADDPTSFGVNQFVKVGSRLLALTGSPGYLLERGVSTWSHLTTPGALWNGGASGIAIFDVVPGSGDVAGGNTVTILGEGFESGIEVVAANRFLTDVVFATEEVLSGVMPSHAVPEFVDVTVTNPDGMFDVGPGFYEYTNEVASGIGPPEISSGGVPCSPGAVVPSTGSMVGGTAVTINGAGFVTGMEVLFDETPATSVNVLSSTQLTCVTPAHQTGAVDVTVITP